MSKAAFVIAWVMVMVAALPARANTDLHSLLAEAPSSDWVELDPTPTILSGEFTSHSYAAYLQATGSSPGSTESDLNLYGFRDGWAREWEQRGTSDLLVERVFEFGDDRGAGYWYSDLKLGTQTRAEYKSAVPISVPNSFAAALLFSNNQQQWRAEFWKGNLMFVVHTDSDTDDLSMLAVQQASTEFNTAPASTVNTAKAATPLLQTPSWVTVGGAAVVAIVIVVSIVIVVAVAQRGREQRRRAAYANVQLSPDGRWWWDGQGWRPTATDPPPIRPG